jgi:hypothetical protein
LTLLHSSHRSSLEHWPAYLHVKVSLPVCGELFLLQFIAFCDGWLRFCFGGIGILLGSSLRRHPNDNQAAHPGDCPIVVSAFIQEKLLRLVVYYNSHSRALGHDHFASSWP